jgi:hypothetical protein
MANVKTALGIQLPVIAGEQAVITLENGQQAVTSVKSINAVSYNQGYIFITIETKNSLYQNIPVQVNPDKDFFDGQIIKSGENVTTGFGTSICVSSIIEVNSKGIRVYDNKGQEYFGDVSAVA